MCVDSIFVNCEFFIIIAIVVLLAMHAEKRKAPIRMFRIFYSRRHLVDRLNTCLLLLYRLFFILLVNDLIKIVYDEDCRRHSASEVA